MSTILGVSQSPISVAMPAGACDCHTHVFGPSDRFPYDAGRAYTPPDAGVDDLAALHRHLKIDRVVIVHPSPYGADNAASAEAIRVLGPDRARGVAVIDEATTDRELRLLDAAGFRGARENLETAGVFDPALAWQKIKVTARRVAPLGWHVQTFASADVIAVLAERLATLPVPLVIDHFGRIDAAAGLKQAGFTALRRLIGAGRAYVKLSAAYRVSRHPDAADLAPFAGALLAENPDACLWGTDWPHPGGGQRGRAPQGIEAFQQIDDGAALARLARWCGTEGRLAKVLVDNPARLYRF
jgi:predicted TIM-barrel fold metal-dependent hydrolase